MVIKRNSWHYKWLAYSTVMMHYIGHSQLIEERLNSGLTYSEIYENDYWRLRFSIPINFCQYWRKALVTHPLIVIINVIIIAIAMLMTINYPLGAAIVTGVMFTAIVLVASLFAMFTGIDYMKNKIKNGIDGGEHNIINEAYKSYKNNVCTLVDYKD